MQLEDKIRDHVKSLPEEVQREVLDFVEYLAHKLRQEDITWSHLSLKTAMEGMEHETWPDYREEDFVEKWQ